MSCGVRNVIARKFDVDARLVEALKLNLSRSWRVYILCLEITF